MAEFSRPSTLSSSSKFLDPTVVLHFENVLSTASEGDKTKSNYEWPGGSIGYYFYRQKAAKVEVLSVIWDHLQNPMEPTHFRTVCFVGDLQRKVILVNSKQIYKTIEEIIKNKGLTKTEVTKILSDSVQKSIKSFIKAHDIVAVDKEARIRSGQPFLKVDGLLDVDQDLEDKLIEQETRSLPLEQPILPIPLYLQLLDKPLNENEERAEIRVISEKLLRDRNSLLAEKGAVNYFQLAVKIVVRKLQNEGRQVTLSGIFNKLQSHLNLEAKNVVEEAVTLQRVTLCGYEFELYNFGINASSLVKRSNKYCYFHKREFDTIEDFHQHVKLFHLLYNDHRHFLPLDNDKKESRHPCTSLLHNRQSEMEYRAAAYDHKFWSMKLSNGADGIDKDKNTANAEKHTEGQGKKSSLLKKSTRKRVRITFDSDGSEESEEEATHKLIDVVTIADDDDDNDEDKNNYNDGKDDNDGDNDTRSLKSIDVFAKGYKKAGDEKDERINEHNGRDDDCDDDNDDDANNADHENDLITFPLYIRNLEKNSSF